MTVEELIKSLEHFDEQEDIKNTFLFTGGKVHQIIIEDCSRFFYSGNSKGEEPNE